MSTVSPATATTMVIDGSAAGQTLPILKGPGEACAVIWPGMGAQKRSFIRIVLEAGTETRTLQHPAEAVYFVLGGGGQVAGGGEPSRSLSVGSIVHVDPGTSYRFAGGGDGMKLFGGPCPYDAQLADPAGAEPAEDARAGQGIRLFHRDDPGVSVPMISRDARLIVWLGTGSATANMNYVRLEAGEGNKPHIHAESEDTIYILEGKGTVVDHTHDRHLPFSAGQIIHVPVGIKHAVYADRGEAIVSFGGPSPADRGMLRAAGITAHER